MKNYLEIKGDPKKVQIEQFQLQSPLVQNNPGWRGVAPGRVKIPQDQIVQILLAGADWHILSIETRYFDQRGRVFPQISIFSNSIKALDLFDCVIGMPILHDDLAFVYAQINFQRITVFKLN